MADKNSKKPKPRSTADKGSADAQMGAALRSVYQQTVEESVPREMLDLLSKLD